MMAGRRALRRLQFGPESTSGTLVAATKIWRGMGTILDNILIERVAEDVGNLGGSTRTTNPMTGGSLALDAIPATFEQFPHLLEASIKTVTGVQDGVGDGYIYTYPFPTTAAQTIKTYTWEGGDDQEAERFGYGFVPDWTMTGTGRRPWLMSGNVQGRAVELHAFTGSLPLPAVNDMQFGMTKLYIDAIGGTWGTTLKSNTLRTATLKYTSGMVAKNTADGRLDFSFVQSVAPTITLDVEFEHDGTATAQKANWRAQTPVLIQLKNESAVPFTTPGTVYSTPTCIFNLAGYWENFGKIGEANGNDILQGKFVVAYNATAAKFGQVIVVNSLATL